jgi:hypothetical protein
VGGWVRVVRRDGCRGRRWKVRVVVVGMALVRAVGGVVMMVMMVMVVLVVMVIGMVSLKLRREALIFLEGIIVI